MRNRGVGGLLSILWLAMSIAVSAQSGLLYLNEEPLSLTCPLQESDASFQVPFEEFGGLLGLEIQSFERGVLIRGPGFRQTVDEDSFVLIDGVRYVDLEWILALVQGDMHRLGGNVYVETARPAVKDLDASATSVTLRWTAFSAHTLTRSSVAGSEVLTLRWEHGQLDAAQLVRIGESRIQEVRLIRSGQGVALSLVVEPGTLLSTEQLETEQSYALTVRVTDTPTKESVIELGDGLSAREWADEAAGRSLDYLVVEAWRDRFRLAPTVPEAGYQATAALHDILRANGAVSALSVGCSGASATPECLVMDGLPYVVPTTPTTVLGIDLFGRWGTYSSMCTVAMKHLGRRIDVDGVNRTLAYGEAVAYAPGYGGSIGRGLPGSFLVLKIREDRVVSISDGPFVPQDSSALLVVASGEAKTRFSSVRLGDPIEAICQFPQVEETVIHAVSAGPQLLRDGLVSLNAVEMEDLGTLSGGTLLACDWQGGLYLMAFVNAGIDDSAGISWTVLDLLDGLPTTLKDAVLLCSCGQPALAYASGAGVLQFGSQDPIGLALSLIPLAR